MGEFTAGELCVCACNMGACEWGTDKHQAVSRWWDWEHGKQKGRGKLRKIKLGLKYKEWPQPLAKNLTHVHTNRHNWIAALAPPHPGKRLLCNLVWDVPIVFPDSRMDGCVFLCVRDCVKESTKAARWQQFEYSRSRQHKLAWVSDSKSFGECGCS